MVPNILVVAKHRPQQLLRHRQRPQRLRKHKGFRIGKRIPVRVLHGQVPFYASNSDFGNRIQLQFSLRRISWIQQDYRTENQHLQRIHTERVAQRKAIFPHRRTYRQAQYGKESNHKSARQHQVLTAEMDVVACRLCNGIPCATGVQRRPSHCSRWWRSVTYQHRPSPEAREVAFGKRFYRFQHKMVEFGN